MSRHAAGPLPLVCVLLLALALRVWGFGWGLPSATHYFSYHPDESVVLEAAMGMDLFHGRLLPHFYNYGSLHLYLVNFANSLAFMFGAVDIVPRDFSTWYPQWARMYAIGRGLTVAAGLGTVWVVYALGARLWGRRAGLLAALLLAVMPLHAQHSHWLTVDVPATFWGTLALYWAARVCGPDPLPQAGEGGAKRRVRARAALLAGLFAGLATATKYNMALAVLPVALACLLPFPAREGTGRRPGLGLPALALVAFVLAFLAACPGFLLEHQAFLTGFLLEAVHVRNADDPTFKGTGSGFVYHIARNLDAGLGLPLLLLSLIAVGYAAYRRQRGDGLLAAFALPYYVLISLAAIRYARYTIPLLPVLALWSGRLLADLSRVAHPVWRGAALAAGGAVALFTLADCVWLVRAMASADTRDRALSAVNAGPGTTFGFPAMPWFQTVPLSPYFALPFRGSWRSRISPAEAARYVYGNQDWDTALLEATRPPVVLVSEYDYADPLRQKSQAAAAYLGILRGQYRPPRVFANPHSPFGGRRTLGGLPTQDLPHDMLYTSPTILVFERR